MGSTKVVDRVNIHRLRDASMRPIKFIGAKKNVLNFVSHKRKPNASSNSSKDKTNDDVFVWFKARGVEVKKELVVLAIFDCVIKFGFLKSSIPFVNISSKI